MQESQYESNPSRLGALKGAGALLTRGGGAVLSVGLMIGIVYWAVGLGQRDATQIPVIRAMEGSARITPADPGGTQADYQGLAVNEVLAQTETVPVNTQTTLAEAPQTVTPEDTSMATLQATAPIARPSQATTPAPQTTRIVDAASILVEVDPESGVPVPETPPSPPVEAAAPQEQVIHVAPDGTRTPLRRPASFYESEIINDLLQEVLPEEGDTSQDVPEPPRPPEPFGNPGVDPGEVLVQLGAFSTPEDAGDFWLLYRAQFPEILGNLERVVEPVETGGRVLYQLRAAGLQDVDQARAVCDEIQNRGVDCLAVTKQ